MCNIAAYAGEKQAAPILIEMLRRQQAYDGDMSTGIATIYEGKIYWRKVIGNVDVLLRETDALSLPGTIGIAHSRPSGTPDTYDFAHPHLSMDEETVLVLNGTMPADRYSHQRDAAVRMLQDNGYHFRTERNDKPTSWPKLWNGNYVAGAEARVNLADYYIKQGKSCEEALAMSCTQLYTDNVALMMSVKEPDKIFGIRTTRPMNILLADGETYMASTRFAFPEGLKGTCASLPVLHTCVITRGSYLVTGYKIQGEEVSEMTPYTYAEGYRRLVELLKGRKAAPLYFDDLEIAIHREMRDLWPGNHTYVQGARLAYEILYQLYEEGRLCSEIRPQKCKSGVRNRVFMWLEEE